ncbi:MAG: lytic transglycosylase domain-containing protein [Bacteroidales bacterium]|nr:lytic transglycosylase domain-containing protein [Bacteroidales bacterium]MDT3356154.1 lytic transglycosylase domain-containing protein [Bacteroidota bacterium]
MKASVFVLIFSLTCFFCPAQSDGQLHPKAPAVPEYIEFAGKKIRFDRDDLYERMDREMIAFTYMHSTSILMLKRSERIFEQIVPILKAQGVPEDLKYLMVIESNLDPKALSRAGAAGLWQMMKATGQKYGLEVNTVVDERYNIRKETVAACKYLKEAYAKYGDWLTVAASYNAGQAGISRQLKLQRQKSAMDLLLVEETSRYMFRILAAKYFFEHPEQFGFNVPENERYRYRKPRKVVAVETPVESLIDFAEQNGISYAALKNANPWLRDTLLTNKSGKRYEIIIP